MRTYHKGWQDKRPAPNRRVRWFQGAGDDIRLRVEDYTEGRASSLYFRDREKATEAYEAFISGATVLELSRQNREDG